MKLPTNEKKKELINVILRALNVLILTIKKKGEIAFNYS